MEVNKIKAHECSSRVCVCVHEIMNMIIYSLPELTRFSNTVN